MGAAVERFAGERRADALVTLGDNDYTESPTAFEANWLDSFGWAAADGLLVAGTLGNHDVLVDRGRYEFELLGMPSRYYQRRLGAVELFLLDSTRIDEAQLEWLDAALARSNARWKVGGDAPSRLQLRRLPRQAAGAETAGAALRGTRRRPRARRPRSQLPALREARRRHLRRPRRRRGRLYSLEQCPRWFPRRVEAHKIHGWLYLRATADSLRVRAIGRDGRVRDRFQIYP